MEKERKFKKATQVQVYKVGCLINEHCTLIDGAAVYADGWSDQAIADKIDVSLSTVSSMRTDMVGKFAPPIRKEYTLEDIPLIAQAVDVLKARFSDMEMAIIGIAERLPEDADLELPETAAPTEKTEAASKPSPTSADISSKADTSSSQTPPIDNSDERGDDIPEEDPDDLPVEADTAPANENSAVQDFAREVSASAGTDDFDYGDEEELSDDG